MRFGSGRHSSLRKFLALALASTATLVSPLEAQYRASSADKKSSPRALAVLQQLPGGSTRLFPVSIFLDGKYYDARFYYAKPVPLALYDATVYVALTDGMPTGEFTVHTARQVPDSQIWWGEGDWKATTATVETKPVTLTDRGKKSARDTDSDHSVLKKPSSSPEKSGDNSKPTDSSKSADTKQASTAKPDSVPKPDNDPDRPVLRKPKTEKPESQVKLTTSDISPKEPPEDPNRPVLKRKQPTPSAKTEQEVLTAPKSGIKGAKYVVAISDPDPMNNRPYDYSTSPSEKVKWTSELSKMAMEAVRKYASTSTRAQLQPNAKFADTQLRAVDLDYSNAPYLIFTGRIDPTVQPPEATSKKAAMAGPTQLANFYVTIVARLTSEGQLNPLLTVATDSAHLDLNPRLELIDAVDADGDNRAELLFRKTTDSGASYVIYRMTPFQMTQVFEGGSGN